MSSSFAKLILGIELEQFFHYFYYFFLIKLTSPITFGCAHFITSLKNCIHYIAYVQGFCINVILDEAFKLCAAVVLTTEKLHYF